MAIEKELEKLKEDYLLTCCVPLDDKTSDLLNEKAKSLIVDDIDAYFGFYVENIFSKEGKVYAKISLVNPYDKEGVYEGSFDVLWEEIKDSDFVDF